MSDEYISHHPKKIFGNIYDFLRKESKGILFYDSELTGFVIWFVYNYGTEKIPELKNKTKKEFIKEAMGKKDVPDSELIMDYIGKYKKWLSEMKGG